MTSSTASKKLLVVDDSKVSRMVIKARIKTVHPDWIIIEAENGDQAIQLAEQENPDFCTMDINMPGILGTDAAEQIKQKHPTMRIVIFSANIQENFQNRAQALGSIFVAKPVTEKSINEALNYFLG
jgi:two-component system chemotaxis response regulator CheY